MGTQQQADVSVVGLGRMGAALARVLLKGGRAVAVWNRDATKSAALASEGAQVCATLEQAVRASPQVIVCLAKYATWEGLLDALPAAALAGRTVIQLSNGAADEATALQARHAAAGAASLDGAILGFPGSVGTPRCPIVVSGDTAVFAASAPVLSPLGELQYLGDGIARASGLDNALVFFSMSSVLCYLQGVAIAEASGLPREELAARVPGALKSLQWMIRTSDAAIAAGNHVGTEATMHTHLDFFTQVRDFARRVQMPDGFLDTIVGLAQQTIDAGQGDGELSAFHEGLRPSTVRGATPDDTARLHSGEA